MVRFQPTSAKVLQLVAEKRDMHLVPRVALLMATDGLGILDVASWEAFTRTSDYLFDWLA